MSETTRRSKGGKAYAVRRGAPPPMSFFDEARPPAGDRSIEIRLGRIRIVLGGLDAALDRALLERYGPYASAGAGTEDALRVSLSIDERDYFLEPPGQAEFNPVFLECEGTRVRYVGYRVAGWFDAVPEGGRGALVLARGSYEPEVRAIENFVRAAVAWRAAASGGALVHAASAVRRDRGYLFYGESGAGKSTLSAASRRGAVVSDDLSLVLPGEAGLELVGSPFRGTYEGGAAVVGSFRLAAGFRIVQADRARVRPAPRALLLAGLIGNLPFVAEEFRRRPDLFEDVERAFAAVPLAYLDFRKDDSYWDAIEEAGL